MGQGPSEPPVCRPLFAMLASKTALRLRLLFPSLDASERASERVLRGHAGSHPVAPSLATGCLRGTKPAPGPQAGCTGRQEGWLYLRESSGLAAACVRPEGQPGNRL